jgi:hypothetical protein
LIGDLASEKRLWKLLLVLLAGLSDLVSIALEETAPLIILSHERQLFVTPQPAAPVSDREEQAKRGPRFLRTGRFAKHLEPVTCTTF